MMAGFEVFTSVQMESDGLQVRNVVMVNIAGESLP